MSYFCERSSGITHTAYAIKITLLILFAALFNAGCDLITPPHMSESSDLNRSEEPSLTLSPMPTGATLLSEAEAKTTGSQSPFGCYMSILSKSNGHPYTYWSVYLHYPDQIVKDAEGLKASYKYRLKGNDGTIYRLANCVIPATREAASMIDEFLREYEKSET